VLRKKEMEKEERCTLKCYPPPGADIFSVVKTYSSFEIK